MRHLAAVLNVREVGKDQFVHTKYSRELVNYPMKDASLYMYVHMDPTTTFLDDMCTDSPTDTTITGTFGETLPNGLQSEAGNTPRTHVIQLRPSLGVFLTLLSLNTMHSTQTRVKSSER
jgi:hypothetical protein